MKSNQQPINDYCHKAQLKALESQSNASPMSLQEMIDQTDRIMKHGNQSRTKQPQLGTEKEPSCMAQPQTTTQQTWNSTRIEKDKLQHEYVTLPKDQDHTAYLKSLNLPPGTTFRYLGQKKDLNQKR